MPVFNKSLAVEKECLGNYYVAYLRDEKVLNINCMETSPNWMHEMKDTIKDMAFTHVR